jgi:DNA-directed RNA polymerase specialized sigma24 family protein
VADPPLDTTIVVQDAVMRTLPRLKSFEAAGPGAVRAVLCQAVTNHLIDEIRKATDAGSPRLSPSDRDAKGIPRIARAGGRL